MGGAIRYRLARFMGRGSLFAPLYSDLMPAKYLGLYMGRSVICSPYGLALVRYLSLLFAVDWLQCLALARLWLLVWLIVRLWFLLGNIPIKIFLFFCCIFVGICSILIPSTNKRGKK